jgi:hypothetical protein
MPNKTITIAWTNGAPRFNPPPGVTHLRPGDTVTLQLTGVPNGGGSIDAVEIYANQVVGGKDTKGTRLCGWSRSGANDCEMYDIAPVSDSKTVVTIVDAEHPTEATKYWFSASGSGPGVPSWSVDPELVNEPGGP